MPPSPTPAGFDISKYFTPAQNFPTLGALISTLLPNVIILAGVILLFLIIGAGVMIMVSAGSGKTDQMQKGQQILVGAIIGFLIVFGSYLIIQLVEFITGVPIFNPGF